MTHNPLVGFFDVRLLHLDLGAVSSPVRTERLCAEVVAGSKAPKLETGAPHPKDMVPGLATSAGTPVVSVAATPVTHAAPAVTSSRPGSPGLGLLPTRVTTTRALAQAASDSPCRGFLRVRISSAPGRSCADDPTCQLATTRIGSVFMTHFLAFAKTIKGWGDGWRTQLSWSASRHATLFVHIHAHQEPAPEFLQQSLRCSPGPALGSDQRIPLRTDKLEVSS